MAANGAKCQRKRKICDSSLLELAVDSVFELLLRVIGLSRAGLVNDKLTDQI